MTSTSASPVAVAAIERSVDELRQEMAAALHRLVAIPSQTGEEGAAQAAMAELMREAGLEVDVWPPRLDDLLPYAESLTLGGDFAGRPNVTARWPGAGGGRSLVLNGHIDTVEPGDRSAWHTDPLAPEIIDGRLYGRGACDMKGGLVANLFALRALRETGYTPRGDVFLQSTISEEDGGAGALAAVLRDPKTDAALISEPTRLAIVVAHGGSLMFRLHVPGLSAHACVRDEGVSAIENFSYLHKGLLDFERRHNMEIDHPLYAGMTNKAPINVGTIRGGNWPSSVPELVVAEGRAGLVPGETLAGFKERLAAEVAALATEHPWLRDHPPRLEWLHGQFAPSETAPDAAAVTELVQACAAVTGAAPRIEAVTYGADMRHVINTGGTPCVMFGAGDVRLAHAPNESIDLDELATAVAITATYVARWCGIHDG